MKCFYVSNKDANEGQFKCQRTFLSQDRGQLAYVEKGVVVNPATRQYGYCCIYYLYKEQY